jgi:hypothetical protein
VQGKTDHSKYKSHLADKMPTPPKKGRRLRLTREKLEQIYRLGVIHCTADEIVYALDIPGLRRDRFFAALRNPDHPVTRAFIRGREAGKQTVRRRQMEVAQEGNVAMLIWLGKQILDQADVPQNVINVRAEGGRAENNFVLNDEAKAELENLSLGIHKRALQRAQREVNAERATANGPSNDNGNGNGAGIAPDQS